MKDKHGLACLFGQFFLLFLLLHLPPGHTHKTVRKEKREGFVKRRKQIVLSYNDE